MSACGKRGCSKRALYMVTVPSYQQDACAEHLADMVEVVAAVHRDVGLHSVTVWRADAVETAKRPWLMSAEPDAVGGETETTDAVDG